MFVPLANTAYSGSTIASYLAFLTRFKSYTTIVCISSRDTAANFRLSISLLKHTFAIPSFKTPEIINSEVNSSLV